MSKMLRLDNQQPSTCKMVKVQRLSRQGVGDKLMIFEALDRINPEDIV